MIKFGPSENLELTTSLSQEEVCKMLSRMTEPFRFFHKPKKEFTGSISVNGFQITRVIRYRNSFIPIVKGEFENDVAKTTLRISMKMHPVVSVFMMLWLGFALLGGILFSLAMITGAIPFNPLFLGPFGMFAFGWLLMTLCFTHEAKKHKDLLGKLLF